MYTAKQSFFAQSPENEKVAVVFQNFMFTYAPMHPPNYMHAHSLTMLVSYTCIYMHEYIQIHMFTRTHMHTYRLGVLPSTLQQPKDIRMLFSCCLRQGLTLTCRER